MSEVYTWGGNDAEDRAIAALDARVAKVKRLRKTRPPKTHSGVEQPGSLSGS